MLSRIVGYRARLSPHDPALVRGGGYVSFAGLDRDAEALAHQLRTRLPQGGAPVAVAVANGFLHWAVLVALDRLGRCAISVADPAEAARAGVAAVIGDPVAAVAEAGARQGPELVVVDPGWQATAPVRPLAPPPTCDAAAPLRIFAANERRFSLSSAQSTQRLAQFGPGLAPGAQRLLQVSARLDALRFHHAVAHWLRGGCVVQLAPGEDWTRALAPERVDLLVAHPADLAAALDRPAGDLAHLPGLTVVADGPLPPALARALRLRLAGRVLALHHRAEVGLVAMSEPDGDHHDDRRPEALRAPWFCRTQVVDPDDAEVPAGGRGGLRHRGDGMAEGYLDDPQATTAHFRDGWFHAGTRGREPAPGVYALDSDGDAEGRP